jgi:lipoyl(octanoyl) transferase
MQVRQLGIQPYTTVWENMKTFTQTRTIHTPDELWILEHYPVYTQGQAGKPEHLLHSQNIPLVQSDRGGQITYHGPGQMIAYVLLNIQKRQLGVRTLVCMLEKILITLLKTLQIEAHTKPNAPGVYVDNKKIASIGLRIKKGCAYHGIALNVNMDLQPFLGINPCGFAQLQMTQIQEYLPTITMKEVITLFITLFLSHFQTPCFPDCEH